MLHPVFTDFYMKPLYPEPYAEEITRFHVFCDGISADSQRRTAARARRERRKRQSPVQLEVEDEDLTSRCEVLRAQLSYGQANEAQGMVWPFSRHPVGCRLIQSALEVLPARQAEQLALELRGHVKEAATSPHANYVLQKVITQLRPGASSFIADELLENGPRFARHRFGCRILCRLLEHSTEESTQRLISCILEDDDGALELCRHNFGHHVVQLVLERGHPRHKEAVLQTLRRDLVANAAHRRASYVVEAALNHAEDESLLNELLEPSVLQELAQARYGLYVVKTLLKRPEVDVVTMAMTPSIADIMRKVAAAGQVDERI